MTNKQTKIQFLIDKAQTNINKLDNTIQLLCNNEYESSFTTESASERYKILLNKSKNNLNNLDNLLQLL